MRQIFSISIMVLGILILPVDASGKSKDKPEYKTRILVSNACTAGDGAESIFGAIAGVALKPIIEAGVKGLGNAIKKAGEDKVTIKKAKQATHFYSIELGDGAQDETKVNLNVGCITIVDGALSTANADADKELDKITLVNNFLKANGQKALEESDANRFLNPIPGERLRRYFSSDIRYYGQYNVVVSSDKTAFRLQPQEALIGKPFKKSNKSKDRDIEIIISFDLPASNEEGATHAVSTSSFKKAKAYRYFAERDLSENGTGWMPMPGVTKSVIDRINSNQKRRIDLQALEDKLTSVQTDLRAVGLTAKQKVEFVKMESATKLAIKRLESLIENDEDVVSDATPITVKASIIETQKGSKFLQKLGEFIAENNETIGKPIFESIDPNTQKTANVAAEDNEDTLRIAAIEAIANFQIEDAKLGTERSDSNIRVAQIKAQQACRKLRAEGHEDLDCVGF